MCHAPRPSARPFWPSVVAVGMTIGLAMTSGFAGCTPTVGEPQRGTPGSGGSSTGGAGTGGTPSGSGGTAIPPGGGSGGTASTGGMPAGTGGASATGGASSTGGVSATGGMSATGGGSASGGMSATGSGGRPVGTGGSSGAPGADAGTLPDGGADAVRPTDAGGTSDANQGTLPNVTLHLAGDSTVMTYTTPTDTADEGWGQELGQYLIAKVTINNQAIGGASVAMFHTGRWTNIMSSLKPGDYVMAAFGANDSGNVEGRHVEPDAYQALFAQMADEVKAKQATFIPVTPSAMQEWSGGKEGNTRLAPYVAATKAIGPLKNVLVDDLNARSLEYLNMIGQTAAMQIYKAGDKAHFTKMGATQMAKFVAEELRRIGSPLAAYLK